MEQGSGGGEGMGGSATGGGLMVMQSQQGYVLQLLADGERNRALMQVLGLHDDFSLMVRQIIDRWDDDIQDAVEEAEENFEPDWSDCQNCADHEQELESQRDELDDLRDELDDLKAQRDEARAELEAVERSALALLVAAFRLVPAAARAAGE